MKTLAKCLSISFLLGVTLAFLLQAHAQVNSCVGRIFVFGDSYSDIGAGYVDGNGPTAVAYLAQDLGLELTYPNSSKSEGKSLDFAVSGAPTGLSRARQIDGKILGLGIQNQVDDFAIRVRNESLTFDPNNTLFFIEGGLNDRNVTTATTIAHLENEVRTLYKLGARHIYIASLPERIPSFHELAVRLNPAIASIPRDLETKLPHVDLHVSPYGSHFDEIMRTPSRFGIVNTRDRCAGRKIFHEVINPCAEPQTYYFYHDSHPSTAVQRFVGDMLFGDLTRDGFRVCQKTGP